MYIYIPIRMCIRVYYVYNDIYVYIYTCMCVYIYREMCSDGLWKNDEINVRPLEEGKDVEDLVKE